MSNENLKPFTKENASENGRKGRNSISKKKSIKKVS